MQFKEDPKNLIVPLELTKIIYSEWDAEQVILDRPDQVYGKALHGQGRAVFKNQNSYEGEFYNGMLHGKGKFTWINGVIYEGEFSYNKITGMGTYTWPDGSVYKGQVFNGLRHGEGKFIAPGQSAIYEGQWQDGLRHGNGKVTFKSGAIYEGEFVNGNKHGGGKMIYPSGNVYQGAFLQDRKCGYGTMQWLSTNEKYFGNWEENSQNGWGTHIWLEPKGEGSKFLRNRYEGEWMNGERSGVGVFYYANGAKYVGEWQANMKQGLAIFITDSGGIILGQFKQDRLASVYSTTENEHGSGILPKEIAPKSKEEQDQLQVQMAKVQVTTNSKTNQKIEAANITKKSGNQNMTHEKLVGLNSPGHQQTSSQLNAHQPKTIEANPYSYLIDFSDLFRGQGSFDVHQIELNVQTMLLRHNSTLRQWYKFFATKFEHFLNENTFALNFEGFWKIIRDAKLLNPNFTIASLNRLFFQGCKNRFPLTHSQSDLKQQINFLKKNTSKVNLNEMDDVHHMKYSQECLQSLKDVPLDYDKLKDDLVPNLSYSRTPLDVQNPSNVVLYRHFIEFLVRIAYLKYNSLNELHRAVERIIINKLTPLYERKLGKGLNQSEEETHSMHMKNKINFEDYVQDFKVLFDRYATDIQHPTYGYIDRTVTFLDVFQILERAGLMSDADKSFIVGHIEKHFDSDEGTLNQISSVDQSSAQLGVSKDEKTKRRKQRDTESSHMGGALTESIKENHNKHLNRIDKWVQFMNYELTLYEFTDVMIFALSRKNKEIAHPKEDEQRSRVLTVLNRLIQIQPKHKKIQQQARLFVNSMKDQQKEELRLQRINQEARAKQRQLQEEQRKKEERERNLMALEDQDVKSDYEEEPESEEDEY